MNTPDDWLLRRITRSKFPLAISVLCIVLVIGAKGFSVWREQNALADLINYAGAGDISGLDSVLQRGYDINLSEGETNETALMSAVHAGKIDAVKFLLNHGASVSIRDYYFGSTAISQAINPDIIEALVVHGANPNDTPQRGLTTPLHLSAKNGWRKTVLLLLNYGANPLLRNDDGKTPADLAEISGHHDIAVILLDAERRSRAAKIGLRRQ